MRRKNGKHGRGLLVLFALLVGVSAYSNVASAQSRKPGRKGESTRTRQAESPKPASKDESRAREEFRLAQAYYDSGRFDEAARRFTLAYKLSGRASLLYNAYVAFRDAQDHPRSRDALAAYMERIEDPPGRDRLVAKLRQLINAFGPPRPFPPEGEFEVEPVHSSTQSGASSGPEPDESKPEEESNESGLGAEVNEVASDSSDASDRRKKGLWMPGIAIAGVGGAALIGGAVTGVLTRAAQKELTDGCPTRTNCDPALQATERRGRALALVTDILLGTGIAAAATGVVLMFVLSGGKNPSDDIPVASFACGPDGCAGSLSVRF